MIPYGRQCIDEDDIQAVVDVLRSDFLTTGPKVREFEEALAAKCGAKEVVVVNSGTAALHTAYFAAGLGPDDEFITSPLTFAATANAGLYLGARPVFCDVESGTGNLDPELLEELITPRTKLIVPVHYAGNPCRMAEIKTIADRHGITVIEDACHALGASYHGNPVGSCSHSTMAVFSFHPVKSITTGEGGAILTNDCKLADRMRQFREHGITKNPSMFTQQPDGLWHSEMQFLGMNYRLPDINCALGISQLRKLERFIASRQRIAQIYSQSLTRTCFSMIHVTEADTCAWHLFPIRIPFTTHASRYKFQQEIIERGIHTQIHYRPVHLHPFYQKNDSTIRSKPIAELLYRELISIPIFHELDNPVSVITRIIETAKHYI